MNSTSAMSESTSVPAPNGNDTNLVAASFITEVLASAGRLEKDDLNAKLGKLFRRIDEVKSEVYESLENEYVHFLPYLSVAPELTDRVDTMQKEVKDATEKIQTEIKAQLNTSTTEFQDLSRKLHESTHMAELLRRIMNLNTLENEAFQALQQKDYTLAGKRTQEMRDQLDSLSKHKTYEDYDIKILKSLLETCNKHMIRLETELGESWRKHVWWNVPSQKKDSEKRVSASLSILSSDEAKLALRNTVQALHQLDLLEPKMKLFGKRFLEQIAGPVIAGNKRVVIQSVTYNSLPCKELSLKGRKTKSPPKERLGETFEAFYTAFSFINEHIGHVVVKPDDGNEWCLMELLGKVTSEQLLKAIIEQSLAPTIPTSKSELQGFAAVVALTDKLQQTLIDIKYIPDTDRSLVEYVNGVNVLFANKKCLGILSQARELMKSDLHNTVIVSNDSPHGEFPELLAGFVKGTTKEEKTAANIAMSTENKLSAKTFKFPTCKISLSCQQLVKLAYEVLHEVSQSDTQCALQLFYTVRQIFEMFATVVPMYHKESLSKLPQLAALHHNNCMFITHHMMTLKHQFECHLPGPLRTSAATFVDLVPQIRRMGTECFLRMMTSQKKQLLEYLSAANGFVSVSEDDNGEVADRAIRQCLHQLTHLTKVWRPVLPHNIFTKSIGTLLRSVMEEVVRCIVALDDISADDATQLVMLLSVLLERSPSLFEDVEDEEEDQGEDEVTNSSRESRAKGLLLQSVPKWSQLRELHLLLNAGLQQISDRWAEGKGPLAAEFTANQVKQLIRAMFQNTDRRAAVLATIRQPMKK